ncbi:ALBINO3-like protein 1, chloroplastic [Impatiens glandulifera]|uniref:ALBINO3-like protein 1, chloroplastic n=1 Tax=Impatiens glandulifera TaxID=253017 RepID=UPI001FB0F09F|nr:ALBINO3-like protein 1, chloroplastic [Impatiens glandulifera]
MASFLSLASGPNLVLSPFPGRSTTPSPFLQQPLFSSSSSQRPFLRGNLSVVRLGLGQVQFPDEGLVRGVLERAEGFLFTIADAAVSSSPQTLTDSAAKQSNDWLSGITYYMENVLKVLKDGLSGLHVPYAYGFAIILLTVLVKAATFPLTKKQVESGMAMRSLQPQIKAIQQRYAGDQEKIQLETARLYKLAGINPLAGCLPTLATIPVWIGLYRALSNVADEGLLTEGFFWIPSLAGPTTIAARQSGSGISWLFPFVDGHPPLGWSDTCTYLVLPLLLIVSQYISVQIMQSSSSQNNDPNMKSSQALTNFLPLMIGYFALSVPSGLSLYWLTNNILSTAQQVWLQKLGGAKNSAVLVSDSFIKEEPSQSVLEEAATTVKKENREETLITNRRGGGPGERFKQLKEQEARRKKQREEEKRKADEEAATQTRNDQEIGSLKRRMEGGSECECECDSENGTSDSANGFGGGGSSSSTLETNNNNNSNSNRVIGNFSADGHNCQQRLGEKEEEVVGAVDHDESSGERTSNKEEEEGSSQ